MTLRHISGKRRWTLLACVVSAGAMLVPASARAVATTGAPMLDYPLGVRSQAMGQTGVADASDPENLFFNAANVTAWEGVYGSGSYMLVAPSFSNDIWFGHGNLGAGRSFGSNRPIRVAAALTMARLSYGTETHYDIMGYPTWTGEPWERYFALTVGASTVLAGQSRVAVGLALKRWTAYYGPADFTTETSAAETSANMFDAGAVASTTMEAGDWHVVPALGLAWVNLGSDIEWPQVNESDPLPSWFNYGASMRVLGPDVELGSATVPTVSATLNIDGIHGLKDQRPSWGFGSEVALMDAVFVRWGRRVDDHYRDSISTWGVALGVPVGQFRARVDYANYASRYDYYTPVDKFGATVVWLFGRD